VQSKLKQIILGIVLIISMFKLFRKAGKPGIYSIIPIYNFIVFLQIFSQDLCTIDKSGIKLSKIKRSNDLRETSNAS